MTPPSGATWTPPTPRERQPNPRPAAGSAPPSGPVSAWVAGPGLDRSDNVAPGPGRPLWVIFGSILLVVALVTGTYNIISLLAHEERVTTQQFAATGLRTIDVDTDAGRVEITGTDSDAIVVVARVSRGLRDTGVRSGVVGTTLELASTCPNFGSEWCWVNYTIEVPRGIDVVVEAEARVSVTNVDGDVRIAADSGSAKVSSIGGTLSVDADNGSVVGTDLSGPTAEVSADNGRIELTFSVAPDSVVARSKNGSIDIAVPTAPGAYRVEAGADNGRENIDIPVDPSSTRLIRADSDNGSITVRFSE